jgi:sugar phosphate isomerase/epimerase
MNLGVQLYPLRHDLAADFDGALARVAAIGLTRVEVPSFILGGRPWADVRQALDRHGLVCPSVHFSLAELLADVRVGIAAARATGASFVVCAAPWVRDVSRVKADPKQPLAFFLAAIASMDLDDWRWNAEQLNRIGAALRAEGLQLAYHSHNFEFTRFGDVVAYDELLRLTDPDLVKLELDCGWVTVAGFDPSRYLDEHPGRFPLLHARDYRHGFSPTSRMDLTLLQSTTGAVPAIVGEGAVDYRRVVGAARRAGTAECFIEREPAADAAILDLIEQDYRSLTRLIEAAASGAQDRARLR